MENTMKMYVTADEAAQILGVSRGYAYKIIRGLNNELKEKGYRVISGKVPTKYFEKNFMAWQLVNGEEMMICQLHEMVKHGAASSIMRTGRVYAIKRTKEALRQRQKQRSGSVTSGNSREKIWILTLRILLKSISLMWRTGLEKAQSRIKDMCLI